jgi:hypothetical protein
MYKTRKQQPRISTYQLREAYRHQGLEADSLMCWRDVRGRDSINEREDAASHWCIVDPREQPNLRLSGPRRRLCLPFSIALHNTIVPRSSLLTSCRILAFLSSPAIPLQRPNNPAM